MKKLTVIPLLLFLITLQAQSRISLKFVQDIRLATMEDDHGNKPFTTDVRFEFNMQGNGEQEWMYLGWNVEYADLSGGSFLRWGFQGGYTMKRYLLNVPLKFSPNLGAGIIHRKGDNRGWISLEVGFDTAFEINDWLDVVWKNNLMQRGELVIFDSPQASYRPWDWGFNSALGIEIKL